MFRRGMPVNPKLMGTALIAALLASAAFAFVSHKGLPGRSYAYATAAFDEVPAALRTGNDARVRGVRVGQVHSISYRDGKPHVRLQLPGDLDVHRDATARIRSRSTLGQTFVEIDPGTAAAGPLGDAVIEETDSLTLVDEVIDVLDADTRAALASTLRELGGGLGGRGRDLNDLLATSPDLLADLGVTSAALTDERTRLAAFLVAAERLSGRFTGREAQLEALIAQMGETFDAVAADGGEPLAEAIKRLPGTLDAATPALSDLGGAAANLAPAVSDVGPAAATLGAVTPDFRAALRESVPTFRRMPGVNALAEPALSALTGTFRDARPLAPALRRGFGHLAPPLEVLAPYAPDLDLVVSGASQALSQGDANGNYLRMVSIILGRDGGPQLDTPPNRNPYPAPGEPATDGSRHQPGGTP